MRRLLAFIALASLWGCTPSAPPPSTAQSPDEVSAAACTASGGTLAPRGRAQRLHCVHHYADAGKSCSTKNDCAGKCIVSQAKFPAAGASASGTCQSDDVQFGCFAEVDNGVAKPALCID